MSKDKNNKLDILQLNSDIRSFISDSRVKSRLWDNQEKFSELCSCLDVINNTQQAIDYYNSTIDGKINNDGEFYLYMYGLFQAFTVQQDAIKHMAESLEYKNYLQSAKLDSINDIRVFGFGHPTQCEGRKESRKDKTYNSVFNIYNSRSNFDIYSYNNNGQLTITKVEVLNLINDQKNDIAKGMTEILNYIKMDDKKHKNKFKEIKLVECFKSPDVWYYWGKLSEAMKPHGEIIIGKSAIKHIEQSLDNFCNKLKEREYNLDFYPGTKATIENTIFPIKWLNKFLKIKSPKKENNDIAKVFIDYLYIQLAELQDMAKKIDQEYSE